MLYPIASRTLFAVFGRMLSRGVRLLVLLALCAVGTLQPVCAATLSVINTNDSGPGSLRAVVAGAAAGDTIVFAPGISKITLTSTEIEITKPITIQGPGAGALAIDGNHSVAVFEISNTTGTIPYTTTIGVVTLVGLTVQNGVSNAGAGVLVDYESSLSMTACILSGNSANAGGEGGGLYNFEGTATLTDCALVNNSAPGGSGGGLACDDGGKTTLSDCALSGNSAGAGGGLYNGGEGASITLSDCTLVGNGATNGAGVDNNGSATLSDCVVVGNSAGYYGGGVYSEHTGASTITGCTFTGNSATDGFGDGGGGAVECDNGGGATMTDDIFSGDADGEVQVTEGGYLALTYCDGTQFDGTGNIDADPQFVTPYNAATGAYDLHIKPGSPCADAGTASAPNYLSTDIDGRARPAPPNINPSIGAYESAPNGAYSLVVENSGDDQPMSLRAAVQCADDYPGAAITFDAVNGPFGSPQTITLVGGTLRLSQPMTITGTPAGVAVDGDDGIATTGARVFEIAAGTASQPVTLSGLTVQHGHTTGGSDGAGIEVDFRAALSLSVCAVVGNSAQNGGGVDIEAGGSANIVGCTFTGNSAGDGGGLLNGGTATLTDDILYGDSGGEVGDFQNGSTSATYSDIEGGDGDGNAYAGVGNLNVDPLFVTAYTDYLTPYNLHVQSASPIVGAGIAAAGNGMDITGNIRVNPPTIGAYEGMDDTKTTVSVNGTMADGALIPAGQSVPVTVSVRSAGSANGGPAVPAGTVRIDFGDGASASGLTLSNGTVTVSHTFAKTGPTTVHAQYTPSLQDFNPSNGSQNVTIQTAPTLTVTSSLNPSAFGQSVTFTATFTGASRPSGSVSFTDTINGSTTTLTANAPISSHGGVFTATYTTSALPAGGNGITATYQGDTNNAGTTSAAFNQNVNTDRSITTVSVNNSTGSATAPYSTAVPVTVTVSDATANTTGTPAGTVDINFGDGTSANAQALSGGAVTVMHTYTRPGRVTVQANYNPAPNNFNPSSGSQSVTVGKAMPTLSIAGSSANNASVFGQPVTFTATLSGAFQPGGGVSFTDSINGGPAVTLIANASLQSSGGVYTATYTAQGSKALAIGSHVIAASYGGDSNNAAPSPASLTQTVVPITVQSVSVAWGSGRASALGVSSSLLPSGRSTDVPWASVHSFTLTFSSAPSAKPTIGVASQKAGPLSVSVSGSGTTYTVTFPALSAPDCLTLSISGTGVTSFSGVLPVLPGDVSDDGVVNASDMVLDHNAFGTSNALADTNGDGSVDINDYNLIRQRIGTKLP